MRRFLVVGCGGSGGAALAYLMDQLRSDLAAAGVDRLPRGWQFVHIDVPSGEEKGPEGLGNVEAQGGTYIGTGPQSGSYSVLDHSLSQRLAAGGGLEHIATWAPRDPAAVTTPISVGAGQYRAVGRMITLSKAREIRERLQRSWDELLRVESMQEMAQLGRAVPEMGAFDSKEAPLAVVVSSMAGGAGASMALDVCRLLTLVSGVDPALVGVYMVSADIFDTLPRAARSGVGANALAMLGEIVAAQTGAARAHDAALLGALGERRGEGARVPFARVFPVGRFVGDQRTLFGDGTPSAVYRGLGRGLAGLMMSGVATQQFVSYDLGNPPGSPKGDINYLGWGAADDPIPWGSFGFASLSMGRDRYAEYAAQRLARSSVDRLLTGHLQPGNPASGTEQLKALLDSQWERVCTDLGMPSGDGTHKETDARLRHWLTSVAFTRDQVEATAQGIVERDLEPFLPSADGMQAAQWVPGLRRQLSLRRAALGSAAFQAASTGVFAWHRALLERTLSVVRHAAATFGLPYAVALVERLDSHLRDVVIPGLKALAGLAPGDIATLPPDVESSLGGLRNVIQNGRALVVKIVDGMRGQVRNQIYATSAGLTERVLATFTGDVLATHREALAEAQLILERASTEAAHDVGLARLATRHYAAWPSDGDVQVPARFGEADNEILLTSSGDFPSQYVADLLASVTGEGVPTGSGFPEARRRVVTEVILGIWPTVGGERPPGGLLELTAPWSSRAFTTDPASGETVVPSRAHVDVHVRPEELLDRARLYVGRPQESFQRFCDVSLRDFVRSGSEAERTRRESELVGKFAETLALAMPLVSANREAVVAVHGTALEYRYKFSSVPFEGLDVAPRVRAALHTNASIDASSHANLDEALSAEESVKRIDVFGSYPNYSPLVFESVLKPVAEQWSQVSERGRRAFWTWRRSRPLDASLPMSAIERHALVAGWLLGQIVGQVRIPDRPFDRPVEVWSEDEGRWLAFPHPLLTPPSQFLKTYDWLPSILESILLAISRVHEAPVMSSLRPYQTLRRIYDAGDGGPVSGILELAAKERLTSWLRTGQTPPGGASRVADSLVAADLEGRAAAAVTWLTRLAELASVHYLPPGMEGAGGDGAFSTIDSRRLASEVPCFRDLAADVLRASRELLQHVEEAKVRASTPVVVTTRPRHEVPAPAGPAATATPEDGVVF